MTRLFYVGSFEEIPHALYLRPVAEMMRKAHHFAFLNFTELDVFTTLLKQKLEECKKKHSLESLGLKNSTAYIAFHIDDTGSGMIALYQDDSTECAVSILFISPIRAILEYDLEVRNFFDISERLEEGGNI